MNNVLYAGMRFIESGTNQGRTDYAATANMIGMDEDELRLLVAKVKGCHQRAEGSTLTVIELVEMMNEKGIKVEDMGTGLQKYQIGRIDHGKPYSKENVELVTQEENLKERDERNPNTSGKAVNTPLGQFISIAAASESFDVDVKTMHRWCESGEEKYADFFVEGKYPEKIAARLENDGKRYWAGDNISEYVDDTDKLIDDLTPRFEEVLKGLVIDTKTDPNSMGTARRLSKMYVLETMAGRYDPIPNATAFPNDAADRYDGMLVVRAELKSMCSHHHQPVTGVAYIGIIPGQKVIGLSKYSRIAHWCATRGTLQEELCNDICREIMKATDSNNVAVYIQATHGCCENRGIRAHSSLTQTTVLKGEFNNADVKKEFFDNVKLQQEFAPR